MSKKKNLLSESQVRRFQTLATIRPLNETESFIKEEEEEEVEMDAGAEEVEMDAAEEPAEADVELDEELVAKFADAVATIQEVSDVLSGGAPEEELAPAEDEELAPVEDEEGGEEPALDVGAEEGAEEAEEDIMEALRGISYIPSQKEVVKVVAQRVARRLQEAKQAQTRLNKALGKRK